MSVGLYVHALRAARPRQLRARVRRVVSRRWFPDGAAPALRPLPGGETLWRSAAFEPVEPAGSGPERLRRFQAHYGEDVLAAARRGDPARAAAAIDLWIDRNPPAPGDAWHPYTTATRAGNWVAALSLEPSLATGALAASLWRQLLHLARNVEDDVLGNHVIRDARGLVLGGLACGSDELVERGRALLGRELPEQVLPDGGHYERSPTYHLVVLRDLLEIDAVLPGAVPAATLRRMLAFAAALARPDGAPALFSDGGVDLAPRLALPPAPVGLASFPDSGFAVVREGPLWLAFRCGELAPAFLPAHAHADALSFQLWWRGRPVVVDPGTATYEAGPQRDADRSTLAHATVAVDGFDQFEPWGAFRSGPLPPVELVEATPSRLVARVRWRHGVVHERTIEPRVGAVVVRDRLEGVGEHLVVSSLPLAPGAPASATALGPLPPSREGRLRSERMYVREPVDALVVRGTVALPAELGWAITLG